MHWHSLTNSRNLTKLGCNPFYKLSCLNKHKVLSNWMFKNLPYLCFCVPCWKLKLYTYLLNLCSRKGKSLSAQPKLNLRSHNIPMLLIFSFFQDQDWVRVECTSDGTVNVNPTILTSVRHSSLHFDAVKLASVCRIPHVFQLCVCYRLSLTLDGFINDLYEQSIFWFNRCLNASFIIYCSTCNYCLKLPNNVLQYGPSA